MTGPSCPKIHAAVAQKIATLRLPKGAKILDAPCGEGELAIQLASQALDVFGADIESNLSARASAAMREFRVADLNAPLPWPDSRFDLIACVEGVEHLENPFAFFSEAHRVTRPGGYFVITTPNIASIRSRVRYFGSSFYTQDPRPLNESARHPLHHIGLRPFWQWRYALHTTGFRLTEISHTHIKPISYLYAVYAPWIALYTRIALRKEKDPQQRARNREILRALTSASLLLGENILLIARHV
jgi:SAM-dependent methyltransferase